MTTIFFYLHDLAKNGITTAALTLLHTLAERDDIAVTIGHSPAVTSENLAKLPAKFETMPIQCKPDLWSGFALWCAFRSKRTIPWAERVMARFFRREAARIFAERQFDAVIHFEGYGKTILRMLAAMDGQADSTPAYHPPTASDGRVSHPAITLRTPHNGRSTDCASLQGRRSRPSGLATLSLRPMRRLRRIVFVHNNMTREISAGKTNSHEPTLRYAYAAYDTICPVDEDLIPPLLEFGAAREKITVIPNLFDAERVRQLAEEPLPESLQWLQNQRFFLSIGRFSWEKKHHLLMNACHMFSPTHPEIKLVIVGGDGAMWDLTRAIAATLNDGELVTLLRNVENPYPILKAADLFLLVSSYEGQPVALQEAAALGCPVVCTDIPGAGRFVREHGGTVIPLHDETDPNYVHRNMNEIIEAMHAHMRTPLPPLSVDFAERNRAALAQFLEVCAPNFKPCNPHPAITRAPRLTGGQM